MSLPEAVSVTPLAMISQLIRIQEPPSSVFIVTHHVHHHHHHHHLLQHLDPPIPVAWPLLPFSHARAIIPRLGFLCRRTTSVGAFAGLLVLLNSGSQGHRSLRGFNPPARSLTAKSSCHPFGSRSLLMHRPWTTLPLLLATGLS